MEKLTDNEIIKALECCNSNERGSCLNKCPYYNHSAACTQSMLADTLDLINRQKAEIERLQKSLDNMTDALVKTDEACRKAETEVIKEFVKTFVKNAKTISTGRCREIPTFNKIPYDIKLIYQISKDEFDNLVKEMVGDTE